MTDLQNDAKHPYREGVLILGSMILVGVITLSASLWYLSDKELVHMSVRESDEERGAAFGIRHSDAPSPPRASTQPEGSPTDKNAE